MADQQALLDALCSFAMRSVEDYDLDEAIEEVGEHALAVLDLSGAGVTLKQLGPGRLSQCISATDVRTLQVEREQDRLQEGPCIEAMRTGSPVCVDDIAQVADWPRYRHVAVEAGFLAVAGIPMIAGDRLIGGLNAYSTESRQWSADSIEAAQLLANICCAYIANATRYSDQKRLADQLQRALDSRILIEEAKDMIATVTGRTPAEAFSLLRSHARSNGTKIRAVAADVVNGRTDLLSSAGTPDRGHDRRGADRGTGLQFPTPLQDGTPAGGASGG